MVILILTVLSALVVAIMGLWALLLPAYLGVIVLAVLYPAPAAVILLFLGTLFEPSPVDLSKPISDVIYRMPPGWEDALGLTTSPFELLIVAISVSVTLRSGGRSALRLPLLVWAVPVVILLGVLYGLYLGAPTNLVYAELRGPIGGIAIFLIAARLFPGNIGTPAKTMFVAVTLLSLLLISRYLFVVRPGIDVPAEFLFAHENSVILAVGLAIGCAQVFRSRSITSALPAIAFCLLVCVAMMVTARRAATLTMLVALLSMGTLLFPKRPLLIIAIAIPLSLGFVGYLGAYWNTEFGSVAQPARAVRSQFDPSSRDDSSDTYRDTEKYNVVETIRRNRVLGVGFGRNFVPFQPLPNLEDFWPLQYYTPHQGVLWLWLKTGFAGISVVLGTVVLSLQRSLAVMKMAARDDTLWMAGAVSFTAILVHLVYSTVDLGLTSPRAIAPLAAAAGFAFAAASQVRQQAHASVTQLRGPNKDHAGTDGPTPSKART